MHFNVPPEFYIQSVQIGEKLNSIDVKMGKPGIEPGTSAFLTYMFLEESLIIGNRVSRISGFLIAHKQVVMSAAL